jgi:alkaline phosphatase D
MQKRRELIRVEALDRRRILQILCVAAAASPAWAQDEPLPFPFTLGVASGDPEPDGIVIWTRLAPHPLEPHGGMPMRRPVVAWEIATDEGFKTIVQSGSEVARPEFAHALHVEVGGLSPDRVYWYRFHLDGHVSPIGRTRTRPATGADLRRLQFVALGCQNFEQGYFTAYRSVCDEDVDFVFHYGDYIYENGSNANASPRQHIGGECYSIDDYRMRHAQYRSDSDLQAAHAIAPWFATYDDHEVSNNWVSDSDRFGSPPEAFALRRAMALQAWYEHVPVRRRQMPRLEGVRLSRRADYGRLLSAYFLDTRQFRSNQPCGDGIKPRCAETEASNASVLSAADEQWLCDGLGGGGARWNLLAQQVMMLELDRRKADADQPIFNMDSWAGYEAPRQRLLNKLDDMNLGNVVVLTGDEHQGFANELRVRRGDGQSRMIASEFVATSISSGGDGPGERPDHAAILSHNPDCRMINDKRGYLLCEVTPDRWRATFKILDKVSVRDGNLSTHASFVAERGCARLQRA